MSEVSGAVMKCLSNVFFMTRKKIVSVHFCFQKCIYDLKVVTINCES